MSHDFPQRLHEMFDAVVKELGSFLGHRGCLTREFVPVLGTKAVLKGTQFQNLMETLGVVEPRKLGRREVGPREFTVLVVRPFLSGGTFTLERTPEWHSISYTDEMGELRQVHFARRIVPPSVWTRTIDEILEEDEAEKIWTVEEILEEVEAEKKLSQTSPFKGALFGEVLRQLLPSTASPFAKNLLSLGVPVLLHKLMAEEYPATAALMASTFEAEVTRLGTETMRATTTEFFKGLGPSTLKMLADTTE